MFIPPPLVARREFCFDIYTLARIKWWNYAANVSHIFSFVIRLSVFGDVSGEYFSVTVGKGRQAIKMFPLAHAFVIILVKIHRVGRCFDRKSECDTDCESEGRESKVETCNCIEAAKHLANEAKCAPLCFHSMLKRDLS